MDDKKKVLVVGALFVVLLGVGAFTMMGGSSQPDQAAATDISNKKKARQKEEDDRKAQEDALKASTDGKVIKNPQYAQDLAERNPFKPGFELYHQDPPKEDPNKATAAAAASTTKSAPSPMPLPGGPIADLKGPEAPTKEIKPISPPEPKFGYTCVGVVTGDRPAALFADSSGSQKIVKVGASIDGDSQVVSVTKGEVKIAFRGKVQILHIGGN